MINEGNEEIKENNMGKLRKEGKDRKKKAVIPIKEDRKREK